MRNCSGAVSRFRNAARAWRAIGWSTTLIFLAASARGAGAAFPLPLPLAANVESVSRETECAVILRVLVNGAITVGKTGGLANAAVLVAKAPEVTAARTKELPLRRPVFMGGFTYVKRHFAK